MKLSDAASLRELIFGDLDDLPGRALEPQFKLWTADARFRVFAATYRDKVRKKLRLVSDAESLRDLELELEIAARLLRDRRFAVEYEKRATSGRRYPDLAVTFRDRTVLHLEAKRMRTAGADPGAKCAEILCDALGQLVPNALNVIVIGLPSTQTVLPDIAGAVRGLRARAERKDESYFKRRGFADARAFLRGLERLCAIAVIGEASGVRLEPSSAARRPLPADAQRALATALGVSIASGE